MKQAEIEKRPNDVVIVTGAGSGLGRAISLGFLSRGYRVVGFGRKIEPLEKLAIAGQGRFFARVVDVSDQKAVQKAVTAIGKEIGAPTILFNNAAVYPHRDILEETPESFMQTVGVNLGGQFNCSHAVLPSMVDRGTGRIVNVGSFAGLDPAPVSAAYSVSKGAALILTKAFVADLGSRFPGIVINDWMPGILNTKMGLADGIDPEEAAVWGVDLALWRDPILNGVVFDRDRAIPKVQSWKRKLFNRLTGKSEAPLQVPGR